MKLLLCSGDMRIDGYQRLDCNPAYEPDLLRTLPEEFPFLDPPWEVIALFHGIEHFFLWEAEELLSKCYSGLAPGGLLILEQPNILFAAKVMCGVEPPLTATPGQSDMWPLYGDPTHQNPLYGHKWGWTPDTLTGALVKAGFNQRNIFSARPQHHLGAPRDFRLEAVK